MISSADKAVYWPGFEQ